MANQEIKQEQQEEDYGVLLYYKYATIPDLEALFFYESNCKSLSLQVVSASLPMASMSLLGAIYLLWRHIAAVKLVVCLKDRLACILHEPSNDRVAKECGFTSLSIRIVKIIPEISNAGKHLSAAEFPLCYNVEIRQYSDLPSWIDNNSEKLRGNNILMYCTGGIRCEMASAYIRSKGAGFENVFQLYGGIQRYLEQYPDGGFFRGKNFVFDHRVSVGSLDSRILGTCLLCSSPFDDYSSRTRCTCCRMLVLVCDNCREKDSSYVCELCQKISQCIQPTSATEFDNSVEISEVGELEAVSTLDRIAPSPLVSGPRTPRKLRILCLHGFRQNASGFKGRTASLAKKLKSIAELVFVDAPHELPFIYQIRRNCDFASEMENNHPKESCNKKFSWLVAPDHKGENDSDWKIADSPFDPLQYQKQTEGFDKSIAYLEALYSKAGPFDGILGFSQGAAMAALVCLHQQKLKGEMKLRFAILCSGFAVNMNNCQQGSINVPSLHIFGNNKGKDRQIENQASRHLASVFENGCSVVIEHDSGHIIPTRPPYIDQIKDFLKRFM
ncbi:hypothetical protein HAX54_044864 [Datura stramonium]|uniref:Rhodanese domain-containing protein n=1 Tax=Datura stramonium TaxID=4076 RepID=A0ABS8RRD3_DATST|nr:hypothetical protein [Datura stramonium]